MLLENIVDELKTFLTEVNTFLPEYQDAIIPEMQTITEKNIVSFNLDFDKYNNSINIFIIPQNETYSQETLNGLSVNSYFKIYITVRKDSPDKLFRKCLRYTSALKQVFENDRTINGLVSDSMISSADYFDGVEGTQDIKCAVVDLVLQYESEF